MGRIIAALFGLFFIVSGFTSFIWNYEGIITSYLVFNTIFAWTLGGTILFFCFRKRKNKNTPDSNNAENSNNIAFNGEIMKKKWYLQTWFICLMFCMWFAIIPAIIGIILLIMQILENKKLSERYGKVDELDNKISALEQEITNKTDESTKTINSIERTISKKKSELSNIQAEISLMEKESLCKQYSFSEYSALTSEECKNKLSILRSEEQNAVKNLSVVAIDNAGKKKQVNDNVKQILRCFNSECDNALLNLSVKTIDTMRNKITKSFESLNKIFGIDGIQLKRELLEYKLEELNLVYTYELKKEQEKEQQRAIKEQMIEEEKVRREIERQKAKIEKDQSQCTNEINKLMSYIQKTNSDIEKQLYIDKIRELEDRLKELEADKQTVLDREANARAGFVYVISNIGSFGEDVYKIGMTRRLEPMDRIKELSSASVPFEFDVHAMIFSDDAPALETTLHNYFEKQSVNRVNLKKEFFRVSIDEIERVVKENFNNTVQFTRIPVAKEYHQTLDILAAENNND